GAGAVLDKVRGKKAPGSVAERVLILQAFDFVGIQVANNVVFLPTALLRDGRQKQCGDDVTLFADQHHGVGEGGIECDGEIAGQGPGRRGPDDNVNPRLADDREFDVDTLADVILVVFN